MLFVLNLNWSRFSISEQVTAANRHMRELTERLGVRSKIIFNCAALGTGENLLPFAAGALGNNEMPKDTLDQLRQEHQQVRSTLALDDQFRANRDVMEMLHRLKETGHQLAAVNDSSTSVLEEELTESRLRDYFGDHVFGHDRRPDNLSGDFNMLNLITAAVRDVGAEYQHTFVVADDTPAIQGAVPLQPRAVVGYLDPCVPWDEQTERLKALKGAGAHFAVVGGHQVTTIPHFLKVEDKYKPQIAALKEDDLERQIREMLAQADAAPKRHLH